MHVEAFAEMSRDAGSIPAASIFSEGLGTDAKTFFFAYHC